MDLSISAVSHYISDKSSLMNRFASCNKEHGGEIMMFDRDLISVIIHSRSARAVTQRRKGGDL